MVIAAKTNEIWSVIPIWACEMTYLQRRALESYVKKPPGEIPQADYYIESPDQAPLGKLELLKLLSSAVEARKQTKVVEEDQTRELGRWVVRHGSPALKKRIKDGEPWTIIATQEYVEHRLRMITQSVIGFHKIRVSGPVVKSTRPPSHALEALEKAKSIQPKAVWELALALPCAEDGRADPQVVLKVAVPTPMDNEVLVYYKIPRLLGGIK